MKPGLHRTPEGVEISLYSAHAEAVFLCTFDDDLVTERRRIPLQKASDGWWRTLWSDAPDSFLYGFRVAGPYAPEQGHRFNFNKLLSDPYVKRVEGILIPDAAIYGFTDFETGQGFSRLDSAPFVPKGRFGAEPAPQSWNRPAIRWRDTVIYETHLKGFSKNHPAIPPNLQGTFQAYTQGPLLDHLKTLGITAAEFMPLADFYDERHLAPLGLTNYWGYNSLNFFVPSHRYNAGGDPVEAVQVMVRAFHAQGLEALVDVVFNHTAESDHLGPTLSLRGIDNASYYHLDPTNKARYFNPTGTGNALNAGHPVVQQLVLDALAYWHETLGFDGFRFDLAPVLARDETGAMQPPPRGLPGMIASDPRLASAKLIAEPWDIGPDGYQLGRFDDRWTEWNDKFRDGLRTLWHPDHRSGALRRFADLLLGSAEHFDRPLQSINFLTAHDGFTLTDLVSCNEKHNEANGENNRDGHGHNLSWNHGEEGPTAIGQINAERGRTKRALMLTLLVSQGVPMLSMGDEQGHSQHGNNNAYCQDNALSWMTWSGDDPLFTAFVRDALALVKRYPALRQSRHLHGAEQVQWWRLDGRPMTGADWEAPELSALVVTLAPVGPKDRSLALVFNIGDQDLDLSLPGAAWLLALSSAEDATTTAAPRRSLSVFEGL